MASQCGRPPSAILDDWNSREIAELIAEDRIEPLFELDTRIATLTALLYNIVKTKGAKAATAITVQGREPAPVRRQSSMEIQARLMAAFGSRLVRKDGA